MLIGAPFRSFQTPAVVFSTLRSPATNALYQVVLVRMASCQRTKNYVAKRNAEGKSKREIVRCLKRYAAREIYPQITNPQAAPNNSDLRQMRTAVGCTITIAARELGPVALQHLPSRTGLGPKRRPGHKLPPVAYRANSQYHPLTPRQAPAL